MEGQLRKLRNRIHPKTGASLPEAINIEPFEDGIKSSSDRDEQRVVPEGFYYYVAAEPPPRTPLDAEAGAKRRDELIQRIYCKIASNKVMADMQARKVKPACKGKYRIKIKGSTCHGKACCEVDGSVRSFLKAN